MTLTAFRRLPLLWFACMLGSLVPAFGQASPSGGHVLKHVKVLQPVPEPPGGLVPYRAGNLWGYCDTLGRVWIKPHFTERTVDEVPTFFVQGFANTFVSYWSSSKGTQRETIWMNARGEYIVSGAKTVVIRQSNGTLRQVARRRNQARREMWKVVPAANGQPDSIAERPAYPYDSLPLQVISYSAPRWKPPLPAYSRVARPDGTWSMVDSLGQRRTRWLAPTLRLVRYQPATGTLLVVALADSAQQVGAWQVLDLVDSTGQAVVRSNRRSLPDSCLGDYPRLVSFARQDPPYRWTAVYAGNKPPGALQHYVVLKVDSVERPPYQVALYDYQGQRVLPGYYAAFAELPQRWIAAAELPCKRPAELMANKYGFVQYVEYTGYCATTVLIAPSGRRYYPPVLLEWALHHTLTPKYYPLATPTPYVPRMGPYLPMEYWPPTTVLPVFWRGVQPVRSIRRDISGYVTRGGRQLYKDKD